MSYEREIDMSYEREIDMSYEREIDMRYERKTDMRYERKIDMRYEREIDMRNERAADLSFRCLSFSINMLKNIVSTPKYIQNLSLLAIALYPFLFVSSLPCNCSWQMRYADSIIKACLFVYNNLLSII